MTTNAAENLTLWSDLVLWSEDDPRLVGADLVEALAQWRTANGISGVFFERLDGQDPDDAATWGPEIDDVDWSGFDDAARASGGRWAMRWVERA